MKGLHAVTFILLVVGGLNWGLEFFGWGLAGWGLPGGIVSLVYLLVGVSALVEVFTHKTNCRHCGSGSPMQNM